jgi:membrane protease YdiL (CAAX protease family)
MKIQPLRNDQKSIEVSLIELLKVFSFYIILQLLFSVAVLIIMQKITIDFTPKIFAVIQMILLIFLLSGFLFYLIKQPKENLRALFNQITPSKAFSKELLKPLIKATLYTIPAIACAFTVKVLIGFFLDLPQNTQALTNQLGKIKQYPLFFASLGLMVALIPPFIEEILFRGYLQKWFNQRMNKIYALLFTALIFTGFHFESKLGLANIELLTPLFCVACLLGYLKEKFGSLWAPIGLHSAFNLTNVLLVFFSVDKLS